MIVEITFIKLLQLMMVCSMCFFAGASFDITYANRAIARKVALTLAVIIFALGMI